MDVAVGNIEDRIDDSIMQNFIAEMGQVMDGTMVERLLGPVPPYRERVRDRIQSKQFELRRRLRRKQALKILRQAGYSEDDICTHDYDDYDY